MSGRFRLDPRAPEPERPAPPPAPAPARVAPPPPPPRPPAATAPAKGGRRRVVMLGAVVVALLLVGGAVAVFVATKLGYPDKYVLEGGDMPSGMSNARLTPTERADAGLDSNPGEMDRAKLEDLNNEFPFSERAENGHAQVLETSTGGRVVVLAMKYRDDEAAQSVAQEARAICSFANGAVLRDGEVVVIVVPEDGATRSQVQAVGAALLQKADLERVCGVR